MITACQRDATLVECTSRVLRVEPLPDGTNGAWLDDSVLYAEGGGQPSDHGELRPAPGGPQFVPVRVLGVRSRPDGLLHVLDGAVPAGPVLAVVDWARRFDHMQQHSAQHLLSAIAHDRYGWPTTSFHLHEGLDAVCDVELAAPEIDASALCRLQADVNAEIRAARPVSARLVEPDALPAHVRSRGLPEGHTGPVRLIEIEGIDLNTCGGTHVRSTAELQAVALLGTERIRGGTRVRFVAGERVLARFVAGEARAAEAAALMSRGASELVEGVQRLLADDKANARRAAELEAELAELLGARLAASAEPVRALHRDVGDAALLNRIASAALRLDPTAVVWLTAGAGEDGAFLLAAPPERIARVRDEALALLGARGGGPPGRLQGRASRLGARDAVAALLARAG